MNLKWAMRKSSLCRLSWRNCVRQGSPTDAKDNRKGGRYVCTFPNIPPRSSFLTVGGKCTFNKETLIITLNNRKTTIPKTRHSDNVSPIRCNSKYPASKGHTYETVMPKKFHLKPNL